MFVISRKTNESVFINELEVTVGWIRFNKVQLIIGFDDEIAPLEDILYESTKMEIGDEISIIAVHITKDKVRLGIDAPRGTRIDRSKGPES
ncbi:carbon storage regulator [Gimesia aquarii]|uniref:Carbon storage regulator n=1 Tax=Gimesia aquarii TaxID=2527964 RepID=A0A517WN79_9PLAN|nr:carbon storage regulator [Gimesia aquarii]QDU06722.1 carbon storage regulator [Gimesia aquarii]